MLIIVSPAKTQTIRLDHPTQVCQPQFSNHTLTLVELLRTYTRNELAELLQTSAKLTDQTYDRIRQFLLPHTPEFAGTALSSFKGDAFSAIKTEEYNIEDFIFAHNHLRILSGLYGILRPLDLMQPYRLEMGSKLATPRGKTLYDFWGDIITKNLNHDLAGKKEQVIINCASKEYSRAVKRKELKGDMITISFKQQKHKKLKTIAIYAKRARGMFVDYCIKNRVSEVAQLSSFNGGGYQFTEGDSSRSELVFITKLE